MINRGKVGSFDNIANVIFDQSTMNGTTCDIFLIPKFYYSDIVGIAYYRRFIVSFSAFQTATQPFYSNLDKHYVCAYGTQQQDQTPETPILTEEGYIKFHLGQWQTIHLNLWSTSNFKIIIE